MAWPGTINDNKDLVQTQQPILLCQFIFLDGSTYYLSTHPLNTAEGGNPYSGENYIARIATQDISAIQSRSQLGIDRIGTVTLHIADADKFVHNNYEKVYGFKGALINLVLILWEVGTTNFSTDSAQKYTGVCSKPEVNDQEIVIQSTTTSPMASYQMPSMMFAARCQNLFPIVDPANPTSTANIAVQIDGIVNRSSPYARCAYSNGVPSSQPDFEGGGDGRRGNVDPATSLPALWCDYSITRCVALGMYDHDSSGRKTSRFTGVQWAPAQTAVTGKQFVTGNTVTAYQIFNSTIYSRPIPLVWGQCLTRPVPNNKIGDPNSTRWEVSICLGQIDPSTLYNYPGYVVVNGHTVPFNNTSDPLYTYYVSTPGTRTGNRSTLAGYTDSGGNPLGDPYGSIATLIIVVYQQLASSDSNPDIQVCFHGPPVAVFTSPTAYTLQTSDNSVWNMLDILAKGNSPYANINIQSFIDLAPFCDVLITATSAYGTSGTYPRYQMALYLPAQQPSGQVVAYALQSFDAQMIRDINGNYNIFIRSSLAVQQPSPVLGSNYNSPITSFLPTTASSADGTAAPGYVAYLLNGSNILSIKELARLNSDTPNTIITQFFDSENNFVLDSDRIVDTQDADRSAGYGSGASAVYSNDFKPQGFTTYQQSTRVGSRYLLETLRGNETGDTRGTRVFEIVCHTGASHLTVGQIVLVDDEILDYTSVVTPLIPWPSGTALTGFLARVMKIQPATNYATVTVTVSWHECFWYVDLINSYLPPASVDPRLYPPNRLPYPPALHAVALFAGDHIPIHGAGGRYPYTFPLDVPQMFLTQTTLADGSVSTQVQLNGIPAANQLSPDTYPPRSGTQASINPSGGSIVAGSYIFYLFGIDANGLYSAPSLAVHVFVPSGTTNQIILNGIVLQAGSSSLEVQGGVSDQAMSLQLGTYSSGAGTYTMTSLNPVGVSGFGPPDQLLNAYAINVKRFKHVGAFLGAITAISNTTYTFQLTFSGTTWSTNQWVGYTIGVASKAAITDEIPNIIVTIAGNTATTLTVQFATALIGSSILGVGDYIFIRALATTYTATTIGCALLTPANAIPGDVVRIRLGTGYGQTRNVLSISGTTLTIDQPWSTIPDAHSCFSIEESGWVWTAITSPVSVGNLATLVAAFNTLDTVPSLGSCAIDNSVLVCYLVQLRSLDVNLNASLEAYSMYRECFVLGAPGTISGGPVVVAVSAAATITHGVTQVSIDGTSGPFTVTIEPIANLVAPITVVRTDAPIVTPVPWVAANTYALGQTILDSNGHIQTVTTAGLSGTPTAPIWNMTGGTTADGIGSLIWTDGGVFATSPQITITSTGSTINGATNLILDNYILRSVEIRK